MSAQTDNHETLLRVLAYCNSNVVQWITKTLNPTLHFQIGNYASLPVAEDVFSNIKVDAVQKIVDLARIDHDTQETSWNFQSHPLVGMERGDGHLSTAWACFSSRLDEAFCVTKQLEEATNAALIQAFELQHELTAEVPDSQITLSLADREKDSQRLVSYSLGCTLGRYSLDTPGLIYAHAGNVGFDPEKYKTFPVDADGILPNTEQRWFEEDAGSRVVEFVRTVWGAETQEENLTWLAESLGRKASETPEEAIRRYLADKFFKDHLQTYKKRPIYWLFSSGKYGAFQALVYLHRYHEGTLARMRSKYVLPLTGKMHERIELLELDIKKATSTAARTKLTKRLELLRKEHKELLDYDEKLRHYADQRISLDLDDGVKVNYGKFGDLLVEVKAVTGGKEEE
jgi:hypothetical protein